ncbi:hybrid sensor histidine kinase/response regulator [Marinobacter sp. SS21]|uniref:hybrid sensor histidine kinase/response regulator n=1 Tax=Marinobacter sp. SS21 TaxID=2979460 RepID=UPI00232E8881|nr:response regulator [Marinobacter sp. SS21]MDC0660934.1 response regulator [Marinobacter sp. SS21]
MTSRFGLNRDAWQQLLMLSIPLACLAVVLACVTYYQARQHAAQIAESAARGELVELRSLLTDALSVPARDLAGLAQAPLTQSAIASEAPAQKAAHFTQALYPLIYQNPDYFQVRWVQSSGREGVRIDIDQGSGEINEVPSEALQDKGHRLYHRRVMAMQPYQVYVSAPGLNQERGQIERPLRPTIRVAVRLPPHGRTDNGYLIINVALTPILQRLTTVAGHQLLEVRLVSGNGDWIMHPNPELAWASELDHGQTVAKTDPELWRALQTASARPLTLASGRWFTSPVTPKLPERSRATLAQAPTLLLLLHETPATLAAQRGRALVEAAVVLLILLAVFTVLVGLFFRRLRQTTKLQRNLRNQAETLSENNQFITTLTNALPGLVAYWDTSETCQYGNDTFRKWLNLDPDTMTGLPLKSVLGAENYRQCQSHIEAVLKGERQSFEQIISTSQGSRTVLVNYLPIFNPFGLTKGFISLTTDISETVQTREALSVLNQALQERSEAAENAAKIKSAFLANMSHEIRTPMNAVLGLLTILSESGLNKRQQDYVEKINGASNALLQVLNDILDLSRLEAGKLTKVEEPFLIEDTVRRSIQLFELAFAKKKLELAVWIDPELPKTVLGDDHRLGQVLNNLLGNALKFTEAGSVTISVTLERRSNKVAQVHFSIKDTGIGIPQSKQSFLFEAFDQADTSTTRKYGGSGLGLAICKSLVNLMGGSVAVASHEGEGSDFHFSLPFEITDAEPAWSKKNLGLRRVLLVEDNTTSAELMKSYLSAWKVHCDLATTAEDGLVRYLSSLDAGNVYDAILVDWVLPGKDGVWLYQRIRNHRNGSLEQPDPILIMVTAYEQEDLISQLTASGSDQRLPAVLTKPVTPSTLFNALNQRGHLASNHHASGTGIVIPDLATLKSLIAGSRLLLVEDNELNQEVALSLLAKLGLSADTASNGREALELIEQETYDLVLMDLHMPDMDGYDATRALRVRYGTDELPVIAMSAAVMEEDVRQAREAGMNDHIAKPIDFQVLASTLCKWLHPQENAQVTPILRGAEPEPNALRLPGALQFSELELLTRFQGDQELVLRLLRSFVGQYRDGVPAGQDSSESATNQSSGVSELARFLHTLKGSAATLGLHRLSQLAEEAEARFKAGVQDTAEVAKELDSVLSDLRAWLEQQEEPVQALPDGTVSGQLQAQLSELQELISRSRLPSDGQFEALKQHTQHPALGERFQTLLHELEEFRYQSALVTLADIERHL